LSLPNGGQREEVIRTKVFEDYIRDHVVSWFNWAQKNRLGVERMEELILVSGFTLVASWAAAAFVDDTADAKISLAIRKLNNGGASFVWSNIRGNVDYHNSRFDPVSSPGYIHLACTDFLFVWKAKPTHNFGSMRLHQGIPGKAHILPV
jgi:hypothetical protein